MQVDGRYRNELKYSINAAQYLAISHRVRQVMKLDSHVGENGRYVIRSIYFDDLNDKALREKINGVSMREKFRIRYYNDDFSHISLEKKMKHNNLCLKLKAPLTYEECRRLLDGDKEWMLEHPEPLVRELYAKMQTSTLRPRVLVSYTREPYVFAPGNVRVTFDMMLRTTLWHGAFLEPQVLDISAADNPGQVIMEVKYDDFLPEIIQDLIQADGIRQTAFSKYCACRRFG